MGNGRMLAACLLTAAAACTQTATTTLTLVPDAAYLAASADRTIDAGTGRFELTFTISGAPAVPAGTTLSATGAFDAAAGQATMQLDMSKLAGSDDAPPQLAEMFADPLTVVLDGTTMYLRFPFVTQILGGGNDWISVDLASVGAGDLFQSGPGFGTDPSALLDFLRGAGDRVDEVGSEDVRGVPTTHLRGTFTLQAALDRVPAGQRERLEALVGNLGAGAGLSTSIPIDVYVDADGLVRRVVTSIPSPAGDAGVGFQIDYFDFGEDVAIEVPDPAEVTDVSGIAGLDGLGGSGDG